MHDFGAAERDAAHVFAFAQMLASRPQSLTALAVIDVTVLVVTVVQRHAAGGRVVLLCQADGVLLRLCGPAAFSFVPRKAQYESLLRRRKLGVIVTARRNAALRQVHHAVAVEDDVGDVGAGIGLANFEFDARVSAEVTFVVDRDRPDRGAFSDRIVEAAGADSEAEHAAAFVRKAPRRDVFRVEGGARDIHAPRGIIRHGLKPLRLAANHAVVVDVAFLAIERKAMDETCFKVRDEQLLCFAIKRNVAEPRPCVIAIIEFHIRKK